MQVWGLAIGSRKELRTSVDILGYYYASISHVSTNYPLNFYTLSIDNSFMKVLKNAKSEMPTMEKNVIVGNSHPSP